MNTLVDLAHAAFAELLHQTILTYCRVDQVCTTHTSIESRTVLPSPDDRIIWLRLHSLAPCHNESELRRSRRLRREFHQHKRCPSRDRDHRTPGRRYSPRPSSLLSIDKHPRNHCRPCLCRPFPLDLVSLCQCFLR